MNKKIRISAFTIAEMLVVMIISGILFLCLFNATELAERYMSGLNTKFYSEQQLLDGFYRMDQLFQQSDSIKEIDKMFHFYQSDSCCATVGLIDSTLFCNKNIFTDTLFRRVISLEIKETHLDSLKIKLKHKDKLLIFDFGLRNQEKHEKETQIKESEEYYLGLLNNPSC